MLLIVDYGAGNVKSVANAFGAAGADVEVSGAREKLERAERIVLPGVGAFGAAMDSLEARGLDRLLAKEVLENKKPFMGVCLGMQLLAKRGEEGGPRAGLGWIDGEVKKLSVPAGLKLPHVGWNDVSINHACPLFKGIRDGTSFYFVHSYHLKLTNEETVAASCEYGERFAAAVWQDNIFATQFHPEKSQNAGMAVLENFLDWRP